MLDKKPTTINTSVPMEIEDCLKKAANQWDEARGIDGENLLRSPNATLYVKSFHSYNEKG